MPSQTSAPPPSAIRGSKQAGMRAYHERVVLSLIRMHGQMHKADMAQLSGLSMQTVSIIVNQLVSDGLLLKGVPIRGRVGQPSVPYSLNPSGAFSLGINVGRRASDAVLLDFSGRVLRRIHEQHPYSTPDGTLSLIRRATTELIDELKPPETSRIAGFGISSPFEMWNWEPQFGAPPEVIDAWRGADIVGQARAISPWPVYVQNDGTAACAAELVLGTATDSADFLYIFIGSFIGGGVVLNRHLYPGRAGYAGAIAPMPMADTLHPGRSQQVMRSASLYTLGEMLRATGRDPSVLTANPDDWGDLGESVDRWIARAAQALALTTVSAVSVIDFETIVIDGAIPLAVRNRLVEATRAQVATFDQQGIAPFAIVEGSIGSGAREIGGATLPLLANFAHDHEVLFKEAAST